ncbi:MAG: ATP-dependent Clp protease adaptor ClpS [Planctomycetes bacterium]|nr:ATP-dependent Clp protease adaptor ClpS [Planctomycetota bacterium]
MSGDSLIASNTGVTVEPIDEIKTRRLPPYNVILENDDHHSMEFVINVLEKALGYSEEKSFQLMLLAHESGQAIVWTGSKEVAELKQEQMLSFHETSANGQNLGPLGVRIEPAAG